MRLLLERHSITITPESVQDVAYLESLGLKRPGDAIIFVRSHSTDELSIEDDPQGNFDEIFLSTDPSTQFMPEDWRMPTLAKR